MPTPLFNFRLPVEDRKNLEEMSRLYGAKTASDFAREMVSVMCSGDPKRISEFNGRLFQRMGEQLTLDLIGKAQGLVVEEKPALKAPKRKGRGKGGKRHAKPT